MATLESEGAALVGGAAAAAACGDSRLEMLCADNVPAKRSVASARSSGCAAAPAQFRRLECEHGAEADLIVVETEYVNRAVILPMQIIAAHGPESSDHHVKGRLDKVIIVVSIGVEAADRAEVIGVLIADIETEISSLKETLACSKCDRGRGKILADQHGGVQRSATDCKREARGGKGLIRAVDLEHWRNVCAARALLELTKLHAARCIETDLACGLVTQPEIRLFESLIRVRLVHRIVSGGATDTDGDFLAIGIIDEQIAGDDPGADEIRVVGDCTLESSAERSFASDFVGGLQLSGKNVDACPRAHVEIGEIAGNRCVGPPDEIGAVEDLDVLCKHEIESAKPMVTFQADQMLDGVVLSVIEKEKNTRGVIESNIVFLLLKNVAQTESDRRFDSEIIIRDRIELADVDVVVVDAADAEEQTILETTRLR